MPRVTLGVCGGIAAYKAIEICRRLVDAGVHVMPVVTADAHHFVGDTTFSALASEPVRDALFDEGGISPEVQAAIEADAEADAVVAATKAQVIPHTYLGQTSDLVLVAPATAKLLGKYAAGISDDLLTATLLATRAPVVVAPAMHTEMWEHPAVQANVRTLRDRGVHVIEPESGLLAGGDVGTGRLADPATIVAEVQRILGPGDLAGQRVLVTAGGTREAIDPVRFIGNRSSGKMGYALAAEAQRRGATTTLVTTQGRPAAPGVEVVRCETAQEMHDLVLERFPVTDVVVMAAAVADFRPKVVAGEKIKKRDGAPDVVLEPTPDILAALGAAKAQQILVGFAAETTAVVEHARAKLEAKRVDLMVANDVSEPDAGFEVDTNRVILIQSSGITEQLPLLPKTEVASRILDNVVGIIMQRGNS